MLTENLLYPYGFVFTDKSYENIPNYYKQRVVLDKYSYFYDERTPSYVHEKDGTFIIMHGNFKHVGLQGNLEADELVFKLWESFKSDYNHFLDTIDFIGGRFVIIVGQDNNIEVFNDATAMRSVYYTTDDQNFIASHYYLVKDNVETQPYLLARKYGAIDFTYDRSPSLNVRAIMPNFKLNFQTKKLERFFPRKNNQYSDLSINERYEIFEKLWKEQIDYFVHKFDDIAFSLTGGNDSRISLAMLKEHKDKIRMFTYASVLKTSDVSNKFEKSHDNDRRILEQMKSNLDLNHEFYFFKNNRFEFTDEQLAALSKNVFRSHGRFLVAYYMKSFPKENSLHIRGNLMEIGRAYLITPNDNNSIQSINQSFQSYVMGKSRKNRTNISDLKKYISEQNKKFYSDDLFDYQKLDLSFWETRMGRWHAEIVNETDLAFESLIPYNMRALIDISLSFPYETRKSIKFFRDLINRNYPVLNFFGYNNFNNLYEQSTQQDINIASPYSRFKNNIFPTFSLYNAEDKLISNYLNRQNTMLINVNYLRAGTYATVNLPYKTNKGHLLLQVTSPYNSKTGSGNLVYEIYKNDKLILKEDMSSWKNRNNINIFNLKKDDIISIKVKLLKNQVGISWQNASKLIINRYEEYASLQKIDTEVTATSPVSILYN